MEDFVRDVEIGGPMWCGERENCGKVQQVGAAERWKAVIFADWGKLRETIGAAAIEVQVMDFDTAQDVCECCGFVGGSELSKALQENLAVGVES
ncbi:hypothetical protein F0562_010466 [Nyssa sinensis]|uniref:Uncharacterized protein n=1 Tax=Nyssa sinensis TaxID=561372 RepID=A0A5J4ZZ68_9ASTE|nr:hypothetical protein F0562_010466 [Nyssa sinensis]